MPSYRCTICAENWPNSGVCPTCGGGTNYMQEPPSRTSAEHARAVAARNTVQTQVDTIEPISSSPAYEHRVERYLYLGFTEVDAHVLAMATEQEDDSTGRTWTRPLNWLRVDKALAAGCTPAQALNIFS